MQMTVSGVAMDKMYDMAGKTVLITGGSRGLGRSMALGFAAQGADLSLIHI